MYQNIGQREEDEVLVNDQDPLDKVFNYNGSS